jgi:hypothetical protein
VQIIFLEIKIHTVVHPTNIILPGSWDVFFTGDRGSPV